MKKVAVLAGGCSAEREVSLSSGKGILEALKEAGYDAFLVDIGHDVRPFVAAMYEKKPDVVFNALHGSFGEDGCVQGLLDLMQIPYTHSGRLASALGMDKTAAKKIYREAGLPVARERLVTKKDILAGDVMDGPFVLKPIENGSSVGVFLFPDGCKGNPFEGKEYPYGENEVVMAEEYVAGRELTVAVDDDGPWDVLEIVPKDGFYDYHNKYTDGCAEHVCPARIPQNDYAVLLEAAQTAHKALGCRGISRSDFRYDDTKKGQPARWVILETNTQPGMTPLSLVPDIGKHKGLSYRDIVVRLVETARCGA